MIENTLSPSEHKLLERLEDKLKTKLDHVPDAVIQHSILVGEYLKKKGCSEDHVSTALCYTLLECIDTTEEERLEYCDGSNCDSLTLLLKCPITEISAYFKLLEQDKLASTITIADRIIYFRACVAPDLEDFGQRMKHSKSYCLNLAKNTPYYDDMIEAFEFAERYYELESKKRIVLTNLIFHPREEDSISDDIVEGNLKSHPEQSFACGLLDEEFWVVASENRTEITINLLLFPVEPLTIYADEEDYESRKTFDLKAKHFIRSRNIVESDPSLTLYDYTLITGIIRHVYEPYVSENNEQLVYPIELETEFFVASIILQDDEQEMPKVGNVVSAVYKLCGVLVE